MATKTTPLHDNTHLRLKELQTLILKNYKKHKSISDIVTDVLNMIKDNGELVRNIMEPNRSNKRKDLHDHSGDGTIIGNVNMGIGGGVDINTGGNGNGDKSSDEQGGNIADHPNVLLVKKEEVNT